MGIILLYFIGLLVVSFLVFVPFHFGGTSAEAQDHDPSIIAHRGASGVAPENTMPAIRKALEYGADYIEIDVQLSKDRKIVLMHDKTVDRTTDGEGRVSELEWEYLKSLDAGTWFDKEYMGTPIPLLEEVLQEVDARAKLLIEIKNPKAINGIEDEVVGIIEKYKAAGWCELQSFSDKVLENVHKANPNIPLHKLFVFKFRFLPLIFDGGISTFSYEKYKHVIAFNFCRSFGNGGFIKEIHEQGKKANAWGCNKATSCKTADMGDWDGIITNHPENYKH